MTTDEYIEMLESCTGPDDPQFRAAQLIAEAWQPALAASYHHGLEDGYVRGYRAAEVDMAKAWSAAVAPIKSVLRQPTRAELAERRGEVA